MLWVTIRRALRLPAVCLLAALCLGPISIARAQAPETDTPYRLYPALDAVTIGLSAVVWWVPSLYPQGFTDAKGCECRLASLNGLDRALASRYSAGFSIAGEVLITSLYISAVVLDLLDVVNADQPFTGFLVDIAVMAEALMLNGAINQIAKLALPRARPLLYERELTDPLQLEPDSYTSFYSAHTSSAFSLALAYAQTFAYRHPESPYRFLVYLAAVAAGSIIGGTRIAAGKHFPSDVLVGAAAGTAFGLLIPWLHRRSPQAQLSITTTAQSVGVALVISHL